MYTTLTERLPQNLFSCVVKLTSSLEPKTFKNDKDNNNKNTVLGLKLSRIFFWC